ncbi:MAG: hypothetical protein K2X71_11105 [Methylobacterium sp.]|uniref:hypothetical protein n=1 Tax=Methylobacterium sp. TaxID=409 RepID=UPI0025877CF2|nr:hypothetical protein [Methylobacterium sp.]MBY0296573.1 hypothetical protein [Methylobacterium sp.]
MTIALFLAGLAAVAVGPALALLTDRLGLEASAENNAVAGMFVALNDNAQVARRHAA